MKQSIVHDKLQPVACPLCHSSSPADYEVIYPARLPVKVDEKIFSARRRPDRIHYQLVCCKHDHLVRSTPVLPTKVLNQLYQQSTFDYQAEVENLTSSYLTALQPLLTQLTPSARILEIGCGNGFLLSALQKKGWQSVYGAEPSAQAISRADKKIKSRISNKPFQTGLFKHSFEAIIFFQTLDHIPDLNVFLEDCYESLEPGGYIFSLHHNFDAPLRKFLGESHPIIDIEHTFLFTPDTTAAVFEAHGFLTQSVTSPISTLSLKHALHLAPLPNFLKQLPINLNLSLKLGNTCIIAQKPAP